MMITGIDSVFIRLRLWVIVVLLAVLGFAFLAQFSSDASSNDDTVRLRLLEMKEHGLANKSPIYPMVNMDMLISSMWRSLIQPFKQACAQFKPYPNRTSLVHLPRMRDPPRRHH